MYKLKNIKEKSLPEIEFVIVHYKKWPKYNIPSEYVEVYEMYKLIMKYENHKPMVYHCTSGIGRTGTLALITYMIDNIGISTSFDPANDLAFLRSCRYKAVQTTAQFILAFQVVCHHYKDSIEAMEKGLHDKIQELLKDEISIKLGDTEKIRALSKLCSERLRLENDLEKSRTELYKLIERMTEKYFKEFTASLPEEFLQMKYCDFINLCNDPSFKDKTCNFNDTLQTFADLREKAHDENASPTTRHRYQCIKDTLFK
uniref:Protein tyrosine phosphatase n=1 Tax=Parastrongyloides trichosuri TaxID=131310 RepID=A0A0N4Z5M6_PARTI